MGAVRVTGAFAGLAAFGAGVLGCRLFPRGAEALPGVVAQGRGPFAQPLGTAARLVARLLCLVARLPRRVADLPGLHPRGLLGLPRLLAGGVPGLLAAAGGRVLARFPLGAAHLPGGPGQLLPQVADRFPDVLAHLADDVADRRRQLLLELVELVAAVAQLLAPRLGDPVDLAAVLFVVGDQAFFFQPRQPGVDRAGRRGVDAHEPVAQQPDDLVAVPRLLVQQSQQVQPQPSMTEYRAHWVSLSISASARGVSVRGVVRR